MGSTESIILGIIILLSLRTLGHHLRSWQLREYRLDRMRAWLSTHDGHQSLFRLWFFPGIFPRPKITGRIVLILFFTGLLNLILGWWLWKTDFFSPIALSLILERLLWGSVWAGVFFSRYPVEAQKRYLFREARKVIEAASPQICKIGIAGSFGKSSTKNLVVHLLQEIYGAHRVLFTPENQNNEIAIAQLVLNHKDFFQKESQSFFVFETGAYARGEIKSIAQVIKPDYALMSGLSAQHLDTFGSLLNIQKAKGELAEETQKKVFYNAESPMLSESMTWLETKAEKIPLSASQDVVGLQKELTHTVFIFQGQGYRLPWPGSFFVINALLGIRLIQEFGIPPFQIAEALKSLPPQKKALSCFIHPNGFTALLDPYSQNPDGTLQAIEHLRLFSGKKIFIGMPLRELGEVSTSVHEQIFYSLKELGAEVYWFKQDYALKGKEILGDAFHPISEVECDSLKEESKKWDASTAVLFEGRLPKCVQDLYNA